MDCKATKKKSFLAGAPLPVLAPGPMDTLRETRAMVLLSLPYPPLPVRVSGVDPLELSAPGEERQTTTHTLIARCLNEAVLKADPERNARRRERQTDVFRRFLYALATEGFDMDPPALYLLYSRFTIEQIGTYFEEGERMPEVVFGALEDAPKGSPAHTKLCEYMAAQSVLFGDSPPLDRRHYAQKTFGSLLLMARDRIGHKMSEEEHARAVEIMAAQDGAGDGAGRIEELGDA